MDAKAPGARMSCGEQLLPAAIGSVGDRAHVRVPDHVRNVVDRDEVMMWKTIMDIAVKVRMEVVVIASATDRVKTLGGGKTPGPVAVKEKMRLFARNAVQLRRADV